MRTRLGPLLASTTLVFGLTAACSSVEPDPNSGTSPAQAQAQTQTQAQTEGGDTPTTPAGEAGQGFGSTISWKGLDVSVSTPAAFSPSRIASYPQGSKRFVSIDFIVTNTSDEPIQTAFLTTEARSGGKPAGRVADSDKGIGAPTTAIAPGQSLTWKEAYPMPGSQLLLTVAFAPPGAEPQSVILTADSYPTPAPTATATSTATTGPTSAPAE